MCLTDQCCPDTECWQQRRAVHWTDWDASLFPSLCCKLSSAETVSVRARVCAQMHFTQQGSLLGRGLGTTVAAEEQLSNLSSCLPEVVSLFFPNKLKLKEKKVTFPSPNWILLCLSLEITLSQFSFHYLHISYQKYVSLSLPKSVPHNRIHCPDFYVTATSNQGQRWQPANSLQPFKLKELGSLS